MSDQANQSSSIRFLAASILIAAVAFPVLWHAGSITANAQPAGASNRVGQPTSAAPRTRIATVDTFEVLQLQLNTEQFISQRRALEQQFRDAVAPLEEQDSALQSQLAELAPTNPQVPQLQSQRQQLFQQFNQLRQQLALASDRLSAEQATVAYRQVHEQVNKVAQQMGYSHVLSTRLVVDEMAPIDSNSAMQEILGRPVLVAPDTADITDAVLEAMNLERPDETNTAGADGMTNTVTEPGG